MNDRLEEIAKAAQKANEKKGRTLDELFEAFIEGVKRQTEWCSQFERLLEQDDE